MPIASRLCVLGLLLLGGCINRPTTVQLNAPSAGVGALTAQTTSGTRLKVSFVTALNPDCSSPGPIRVEIATRPGHGRFEVDESSDFPDFPPQNSRSACNRTRVPGKAVYYTSEPGFRGADTFVYTSFFPNGGTRTTPVVVSVQ